MHARMVILEQRHDEANPAPDAAWILEGLTKRRWRVSRGVYEFYAADAARVLGRPGTTPECACRSGAGGQVNAAVPALHSIAVSPDGRMVAFGVSSLRSSVLVVPTDGGKPNPVFDKSTWGVAWSKDGRSLFARGLWTDGEIHLLRVPLDGGPITPTGLKPKDDASMALDAAGTRLAFVKARQSASVVSVRNLLPANERPPAK
jgi:hypothetical protein